MFDEKEWEKKFSVRQSDKVNKAWGNSTSTTGRRFPFLSTSKLDDGSYTVRILPPHPEHCPEGWLRVAIHWLFIGMGDEKPTRFECIRDSETACYICQIQESLAEDKDRLPTQIQEILTRSVAIPKLVLPVSINAEPYNPGEISSKFKKSATEKGAMLEISAAGLQRKIFNLLNADRYFTHADKGRYFLLTKNHNMLDVVVSDNMPSCPLNDKTLIDSKTYPHMTNAYFNKNVNRFNFVQQQEAVDKSWWMQDESVRSLLAANFYDDPQGEEEDESLPWD
jgi:hypothetical protein